MFPEITRETIISKFENSKYMKLDLRQSETFKQLLDIFTNIQCVRNSTWSIILQRFAEYTFPNATIEIVIKVFEHYGV